MEYLEKNPASSSNKKPPKERPKEPEEEQEICLKKRKHFKSQDSSKDNQSLSNPKNSEELRTKLEKTKHDPFDPDRTNVPWPRPEPKISRRR